MAGIFKFIDHTADIAVEISADNYADLFIAAASAWKDAVIEPFTSDAVEPCEIKLEESSIEELLVEFLSELNFLLLTKKWVFGKIKNISINKDGNLWKLSSTVLGNPFNNNKHNLKVEIKAVTFHQMDVKYIGGKYTTRIVFDI